MARPRPFNPFTDLTDEEWSRLKAAQERKAEAWEAEKRRWRRCYDPECREWQGIHYHRVEG